MTIFLRRFLTSLIGRTHDKIIISPRVTCDGRVVKRLAHVSETGTLTCRRMVANPCRKEHLGTDRLAGERHGKDRHFSTFTLSHLSSSVTVVAVVLNLVKYADDI